MRVKETRNAKPVSLTSFKPECSGMGMLRLRSNGYAVYLDHKTAQQLLPILEHFIKTGELPDAS